MAFSFVNSLSWTLRFARHPLKPVSYIQCLLYLDLILIQVLSWVLVVWSLLSLLLNPSCTMSDCATSFARNDNPFDMTRIPLDFLPKNSSSAVLFGPKRHHFPYFNCRKTLEKNLISKIQFRSTAKDTSIIYIHASSI